MFVAARWDRAAWIPRLKKSVKSVGSNEFSIRVPIRTRGSVSPGRQFFPAFPYPHSGLVKTDRKRGFSVAIETQSWFVLSVESAPLSPLKIERNFSLRFDSRLVIDLSPNFPIFRSKSYLVFPPFAIFHAFKIHLFFFFF